MGFGSAEKEVGSAFVLRKLSGGATRKARPTSRSNRNPSMSIGATRNGLADRPTRGRRDLSARMLLEHFDDEWRRRGRFVFDAKCAGDADCGPGDIVFTARMNLGE